MVSQPTLLGSSLGFRFSFGCGGELVVCEDVGWFACTYRRCAAYLRGGWPAWDTRVHGCRLDL